MATVNINAADTLTAIRGWLHDDLTVHRIHDQINRDANFFGKVRRSGKEVYGRGAALPIVLQGNRNAVGARGELDYLPTPGVRKGAIVSSQQDYGLIGLRYNTMRLAMTEQAIRAASSDAGSWMRETESIVEDGMRSFANDLNRQCLSGDGSGKLAKITSVVSATVLEIEDCGGFASWPSSATDPDGAKFLETNDVIAVYTGSTFKDTDYVVSVDYSLTPNRITVGSTTLMTAGDYIYKGSKDAYAANDDDNYNAEIEGVPLWVSDTSTAANIAPGTAGNERWKSTVIDYSSAPVRVSDAVLHQLKALIERRAGFSAGKRLVHWTTPAVKMDYALQLTPDKRYNDTITLPGGYGTVSFAGSPIMEDKDCLPGHWWMLCMDDLYFYNQGGIFWMERDGRMARIADKTAWEMTACLFGNLGTPVRNAHGLIKGLTEPFRVDQFNS